MSIYDNPPYNPYEPNIQNYEPDTLPVDEIIRRAIQTQLLDVRVHMPVVIVAILGNQKVNVQPLLQSRYANNDLITLPPLNDVPVQMPMGQDWSIKLPLAVGDTGSVIFSDRSLDNWLSSSGGVTDPQDTRSHDLSDAIFVPGLVPFSGQTTDATTDLVLTNGQAQLRIQKGGRFKLQNQAQELIANLVSLVNTLTTASTVGGGPFTPSVVTALQTILTNLQTLEGA